MPDKRLIDYIRKTLSSGYSQKRVREALLKKGWKSKDVDEALSLVLTNASSENNLKSNNQKTPQDVLNEYSSKINKKSTKQVFPQKQTLSLNQEKNLSEQKTEISPIKKTNKDARLDTNKNTSEKKDPFKDFNQENKNKKSSGEKEVQEQKQEIKKSSGEKEENLDKKKEGIEEKKELKKTGLKGLKITLIFLIILFLIVLGFGVWYFFFNGAEFFNFFS